MNASHAHSKEGLQMQCNINHRPTLSRLADHLVRTQALCVVVAVVNANRHRGLVVQAGRVRVGVDWGLD